MARSRSSLCPRAPRSCGFGLKLGVNLSGGVECVSFPPRNNLQETPFIDPAAAFSMRDEYVIYK
jgi:hypothetical protein